MVRIFTRSFTTFICLFDMKTISIPIDWNDAISTSIVQLPHLPQSCSNWHQQRHHHHHLHQYRQQTAISCQWNNKHSERHSKGWSCISISGFWCLPHHDGGIPWGRLLCCFWSHYGREHTDAVWGTVAATSEQNVTAVPLQNANFHFTWWLLMHFRDDGKCCKEAS